MFNHRHYIPVLKGRRAEFPAIANLKSQEGLTPLFEAVPTLSADFIPKKMQSVWKQDRPYFIDLLFLDDADLEGEHPIVPCFAEAKKCGQKAVPVTGTARSAAYQEAVAVVVKSQGHGCAIRLVSEDFDEEDQLEAAINEVVELVNVPRKSIDVIIDLDTVAESASSVVVQRERAIIEMLPSIKEWRTLTVIAGAFPLSLSPLDRDAWNTHRRDDWQGWEKLVTGKHKPERLPAYGDYTIANPNLPPAGRTTILAQLRYSTPTGFLIWKGRDVFKNGFEQFYAICKSLISRSEYQGATFSFGDQEIYEKATTAGSPGNAETWRRIGTNHHLETVMTQIASLPEL